jgi:hypothetical protein
MMISEFFEQAPAAYESPKDDKSTLKISDTRKTRLTLAQINRLRTMNDVLKFEHEKHLEKVSRMYKPPADTSALGGAGGASL